MKLVCVIHSLDGGGAERVMAALASRLARGGDDVTLITLDDGAVSRHRVADQVQLRRLDVMKQTRGVWQKLLYTRRRLERLRQAIKQAQPDVVLSFCDRTNILTLLAARSLSVPVVVAERSDPAMQHLGPVWEGLRRLAYPRAAAIVSLTDTAAKHLRQRFKVPVHVIASAVDRPEVLSDRTAAIAHRQIIGIGRLEAEKGFDRLIEAFARLAADHPQWRLKILGEGSQRAALEMQVASAGLQQRVDLPGWVQPVWEELAASTLFVLPSRYEGFPSALLEAMAAGVPSVAVDCESGPRAVLTEPQLGLLVDNDLDALIAAIDRMIRDEAQREAIGRAGRMVADRFDWDTMVERYREVLQRAASQRDERHPHAVKREASQRGVVEDTAS